MRISLTLISLLTTAGALSAAQPVFVPGGPLRLLVLTDGRVVEGTVQTDAHGYRVKTLHANLFVAYDNVRFEAADLHDAYRKLCESNVDPTVRRDLVLGRWCVTNRLLPEAANHFRKVLHVDATNREARMALATLGVSPEAAAVVEEPSSRPPSTGGRGGESFSRISHPAVKEYVTSIQPLLLARCGSARCHGQSSDGPFRLERVHIGSGSNRVAGARNLAAVLKRIDPKRSLQSPLLDKAVHAHGDLVRSPLQGVGASEQEARLTAWVQAVAVELRRLKREELEQADLSGTLHKRKRRMLKDPQVLPAAVVAPEEPTQPPTNSAPSDSSGGPGGKIPGRDQPKAVKDLGPLVDPFDPTEFNAGQQHQR